MAQDTRTVLKNFNRDLLNEELVASALPFLQVELSGFERINQFVGAPTTEPRLISRRLVDPVNKTYVEDFAQPGELRFEFSIALSGPEGAMLDSLLTAHDVTQRTAEQQRVRQEETDLDTLIVQFPNVQTMNNSQLRQYVKLLARVYLRDKRQPPI